MSEEVVKKDEKLAEVLFAKKDVLISRLKLHAIDRSFEDYANDILYAVSKSEDLQKCSARSIVDSAFQLAKAGLSIGGNVGHLVPYNAKEGVNWVKKCQFQVGYAGYSLMLNRVIGINKQLYDVIYEGDEIDYPPQTMSTDENGNLKSVAKFNLKISGKKHKIIGAFAYILLKDGNSFFLHMDISEINKYKPEKTSSSFWGKWDELMYAKQVYKVLARKLCNFYCQTSPEMLEVVGEDENQQIKNVSEDNKPKSMMDEFLEPKEVVEEKVENIDNDAN